MSFKQPSKWLPLLTAFSKSEQAPDGQVLETQEIQHLPYHLRFLLPL